MTNVRNTAVVMLYQVQQCSWQVFGLQLLLLTARAFAQPDQYYQAGSIVGGMASPTGRPYYACPPGFLRMANSCYRLSTSAATWREAHFQCRDLGAQLAAFERPWEDKTVRRFLNNANLQPHERWIGASYDSRSHHWIWAAKAQPATYKSFPRRFVTRDWSWHCLALDPVIRYQWRPRPCIRRNHYLCEMPLHCVVGPTDGVFNNSTSSILISGSRCSSRRIDNVRHRRPGLGRRFGSSDRPRRPESQQRIPGLEQYPEAPIRRGGGRRRDRGRQGKRGRNRSRFAGREVEHQPYQGRHSLTARPYFHGVYTDETLPITPRGILSNIERRRNERLTKDSINSQKTMYTISNEIPLDPLDQLTLIRG